MAGGIIPGRRLFQIIPKSVVINRGSAITPGNQYLSLAEL